LLEADGLEEERGWLEQTWGFDYGLPVEHSIRLRKIAPPVLPPAPPVIAPLIRAEVAYVYAEPWLWLGTGKAGCRVRWDGSEVEVWGSSSGYNMPLYLGIVEALRALGWVPLHGAALIEADSAVFYTAKSGTGKTTTMLSALLAGQRPVTEDTAILDARSGMLYGLDRGLNLLPDTYQRFKQALPEPSHLDPVTGKRFIPFAALGHALKPARLRRVVQLSRDLSQPSQWSTLSPVQASLALWEATGVPLIPQSQVRTNAALSALLRHLEFKHLRIGNTPLFEPVSWA
jgi:hypothetical protein